MANQNWKLGFGVVVLVGCVSTAGWAQSQDDSVAGGSAAQAAQTSSSTTSKYSSATQSPTMSNSYSAPARSTGTGTTAVNTTGTSAPAEATVSMASPNQTATGQTPLQSQAHEGFWGQMNPMARKKWVNRQTTPIKERLNEIDQLTAKNAVEIRDLDERATAGIRKANATANAANTTATDASNRAEQAQEQAQIAADESAKLNFAVSNLDRYKTVTDAEVRFRPGSYQLGSKSREELDQLAEQLNGQKGYIIQVSGFTRTRGQAGIAVSEKMADSVVRYLVEQKRVPLYRIYKMGYGSAHPADVVLASGSVVQVTLMRNSLSELTDLGPDHAGQSIGATQPAMSATSPGTAASQPAKY
jgi:outer membrane protein OmpA-like peptidoglycan-associated protein